MKAVPSPGRTGFDTLRTVETPEGVRLELRAAGPVPRALAYGLDLTIRGVAYFAAAIALVSALGGAAVPALMLLAFVGEWFYPVLFEVLANGQTIGKRVVGLRVVNDDGTPIGWGPSLLRNLLFAADALPGTFLVGLASMMTTHGFQRVGDLAAGTLVLHCEPVAMAKPTTAGRATPGRSPTPPPLPLSLEEQRAVIAFGERAHALSEQRAEELAQAAQPLLDPNAPAKPQLLDMAAWLSGSGEKTAP